ncbi:MAG TPA: RagB/SusD family nutrient uptake outer membrane protein [Chitinophaga sp.]|uniref:RagB/SusD family nutrient uptake outer membrane protein n=1 Tax=Chitinophaga sp. TaxID=1869181 RepID=UPI002BF9036F|nr:RagB/SusD family nutrient uptake outer membrane protein [Chitinophaga sp.]HVI45715.1 RagB/SusD family nutrient uptake outer membrane protein [Chitinophaga sp.]
MKIHRLLYTIAAILPAFVSCNKFLDVKPKGKLIPTEVADFDHLLDNDGIASWNFMDNNRGSLLPFLTDNISLTDGLGNIAYKANNHPNIDRFYAYTFRQPYKNPAVSDWMWSSYGTYGNMAYFNNVIDGIKSLQLSGPEEKEYAARVVSQALIDRAWSYFITTQIYGPVYKPGGNNSTKSIPYVTSADQGAPMPDLSTQGEAFAKVLADIHTALPGLPEVTSWPSRPNKATGQALLAYYHLFTQKYDSVVYYANLAWTAAAGSGPDRVIYDYNSFSLSTPDNPLTSLIKGQDNFLTAANSREMLFFRRLDAAAGTSPYGYASDEFIALFDSATDLRYKYFLLKAPGYKTTYNSVTYDDGARLQYYRTASAGGNAKTWMTAGFSYPELLLMRAEGYARTNRLADAINDLNTLRKYRYKTGTPPLTVGSQDEVIKAVLDERRRELPVGSFKRLLDLKRFCLEGGKPWGKTTIQHKLGNQTFTGAIDSKDFILTISNIVLQFNPQWGVPVDTRPF